MSDENNTQNQTPTQGQNPMSGGQPNDTANQTENKEQTPAPLKKWNKGDVKRFVPVGVQLPFLYPDYEPWEFKLRYALSKEMDDKKEEFLSLSAAEQKSKVAEQNLDELCDLMLELPTGFGDLDAIAGLNPNKLTMKPGEVFKAYVTETTDPMARKMLDMIIKAANDQYWTVIAPRPFRRAI